MPKIDYETPFFPLNIYMNFLFDKIKINETLKIHKLIPFRHYFLCSELIMFYVDSNFINFTLLMILYKRGRMKAMTQVFM